MTSQNDRKLFAPVQLGAVALKHRVVMAPLTRLRSEVLGDVPGPIMAEYYGQRASDGGLLIAEATTISISGRGYLGAPGIYSQDQVSGWQKVTEAVHKKGGQIFLQLWHVGRVAHLEITGGVAPVGPSAIPFEGLSFTQQGWVPTTPNRALALDEIPTIIADYFQAAINAKAAGFDGVELHAGNGYLIDQFIQDGSNKRTDAYGGPVANRARLLLEVTKQLVDVWGADRVGVRLSQNTQFNSMSDSNPSETFDYIAGALDKFGLAYLHIIEPRIKGSVEVEDGLPPVAAAELGQFFKGKILTAGGFDPQSAEAIVKKGDADAVVFGRYFISNPDLPERIKNNQSLNAYDRDTFYGGTAHGYTDYPTYAEVQAQAQKQQQADKTKVTV